LKLGRFFSRFEGRDDSGGNMNNRSRVIALSGAGKHARIDLSSYNSTQSRIGLLSTASGSLMSLLLAAGLALLLVYFQPQLANYAKELSAFSVAYDVEQHPQIKAFDEMLGLSNDANGSLTLTHLGTTASRSFATTQPEEQVESVLGRAEGVQRLGLDRHERQGVPSESGRVD